MNCLSRSSTRVGMAIVRRNFRFNKVNVHVNCNNTKALYLVFEK